MWTQDALRSELRAFSARVWRIVELQSRVSTMRLVDGLAEQRLLEDILEATKPLVPEDCRKLHYLLATPFRYAPYPHDSRFRRAGDRRGVFYAALEEETAAAEVAFYLAVFFAEAPGALLPSRGVERTSFQASVSTGAALDLAAPPLDADSKLWTRKADYEGCHALADAARDAGAEALIYTSVRDPRGRRNAAILACNAFASTKPLRSMRTWRFFVGDESVRAARDFPAHAVEFSNALCADDPRLRDAGPRP